MRKKLAFFLLTLFVCAVSIPTFAGEGKHATTKEQCADPNFECWCSQECGWRKKTAKDHPTYIENDPYGKYCYCKKWDYEHYEDNCILKKNVKQSPDAK